MPNAVPLTRRERRDLEREILEIERQVSELNRPVPSGGIAGILGNAAAELDQNDNSVALRNLERELDLRRRRLEEDARLAAPTQDRPGFLRAFMGPAQ